MGDLQAVQGRWLTASMEVNGVPLPPAARRALNAGQQFVVEGERFRSTNEDAPTGAIILDEMAHPKRVTMRFETGPGLHGLHEGIYELSVDDWLLCLDVEGREAPDAFATSPGSGRVLLRLVRA